MFSVRIVDVDYYLSSPFQGLDTTYSQFRGSQVKQVPVIRIFGSTPTGEKTCLHIHGVFPYLMIPFDGSGDVQRFMYILASSLDKAINISLGVSTSSKQHVFKIIQVSGRPFYGYHGVEHQFLKIFFYNPSMVKKATDLLQNGAICNRVFQPHEAHVPFTLQFFIDYNLHGMSYIHLKHVVFRNSEERASDSQSEAPMKASRCEIEVDALSIDIANKLDILEKPSMNPGLVAIWEEEKLRSKEEFSILDSEESQPRINIQPTLSEMFLKDKLRNIIMQQLSGGGIKTTPQSMNVYPAETQEGCDMLNASAVNNHCVTFNSVADETIINEDVIHNLPPELEEINWLTQDQSLLNVLQELETDLDEHKTDAEAPWQSHRIEDDSILGSQLLMNPDEEEDLLQVGQQVEETDDPAGVIDRVEDTERQLHFEDIPQIDGNEDLLERVKLGECKNLQRKTCNLEEENNPEDEDDDCCIVIDECKMQTNVWPLVGMRKEDCCDEVFFNSNDADFVNRDNELFEDSDVIKLEMDNDFDHVLRGDPSFTSHVVGSSEETSPFLGKDTLSSNWNPFLQPVENVDCDDFLFSKLNETVKSETVKSELPTIVGLTDVEKNVQFSDVPLLNISECDENVYSKYVEAGSSLYSEESTLSDILKCTVSPAKPCSESAVQSTCLKSSPRKNASRKVVDNQSEETKELQCSPSKSSPISGSHKKILVKLKFPSKDDNLNKKPFIKTKPVRITKKQVLAYLKSVEKLQELYLVRSVNTCIAVSELFEDDLVDENENESFSKTLPCEYKLKDCFVSLERLQTVCAKSTNDKQTNAPNKIRNSSSEIFKSKPCPKSRKKPLPCSEEKKRTTRSNTLSSSINNANVVESKVVTERPNVEDSAKLKPKMSGQEEQSKILNNGVIPFYEHESKKLIDVCDSKLGLEAIKPISCKIDLRSINRISLDNLTNNCYDNNISKSKKVQNVNENATVLDKCDRNNHRVSKVELDNMNANQKTEMRKEQECTQKMYLEEIGNKLDIDLKQLSKMNSVTKVKNKRDKLSDRKIDSINNNAEKAVNKVCINKKRKNKERVKILTERKHCAVENMSEIYVEPDNNKNKPCCKLLPQNKDVPEIRKKVKNGFVKVQNKTRKIRARTCKLSMKTSKTVEVPNKNKCETTIKSSQKQNNVNSVLNLGTEKVSSVFGKKSGKNNHKKTVSQEIKTENAHDLSIKSNKKAIISNKNIKSKKRQIKVPVIHHLDGTVDSTSSSDESISVLKVRTPERKRKKIASAETPTRRYSRLNVEVKKSPKREKPMVDLSSDIKINKAVVQLIRCPDALPSTSNVSTMDSKIETSPSVRRKVKRKSSVSLSKTEQITKTRKLHNESKSLETDKLKLDTPVANTSALTKDVNTDMVTSSFKRKKDLRTELRVCLSRLSSPKAGNGDEPQSKQKKNMENKLV